MFDTVPFWAFVIITAALSYVIPREAKRVRACILIVISLLILHQLADLNWLLILILITACVWIAVGILLTRGISRQRPFTASILVISPILLVWMLGKQATALNQVDFKFLYFVGFSFFLIKAWTLTKDFHDGRIQKLDPFVLAAYFLYFPTYISGPMHLYTEFDQTIQNPKAPDAESFVDVLFRILLGLVKIKIIAPLFVPVSLVTVQANGGGGLKQMILGSFAYSIIIWADFSGYCDLAIATSRTIGLQTPENFNYPYMAVNLRDFWQRWHITFSRALTSYIFIPLSRTLQGHLGDKNRTILVISYLVTFGFCGYWHGPTLNFTIWGLYHAAGLIISDLYRPIATKRRLRRRGNPRPKMVELFVHSLSMIGTFVYVSLGWIFFVLPVPMIFRW